MLDKNMGTSASAQPILAQSATNVAHVFLHLSNPRPYHRCKTNPYAQQPFWTAKDLQMQSHTLAEARKKQSETKEKKILKLEKNNN